MHYFDRPVIIAMPGVRMMQPPFHQIVQMRAVGQRFVATARPVLVFCIVTAIVAAVRAVCGIAAADFQNVFLNLISIARRMVQVAIMEVVHVPIVLNGDVTAARAVFVIVIGVRGRMVRVHGGN